MKKMLCILALLICCVLLLTIPAFAEETSGSCGDGVIWSYDQSTATLTISGTGAVEDFDVPSFSASKFAPWNHFRWEIKKLVVQSGVTYLGKYSTNNMMVLQEVILADTVVELTDKQFENCPKLETVTLSQNLTAIGNSAFKGCAALREIHMSNKVQSVGDAAFQNCTSLEKATLSDSLTGISPWMFDGCTSLQTVKIPAGVKEIWRDAFSNCTSLHTVELPAGLESIMTNAFDNCKGLLGIRIPASVKTIRSGAFSDCSIMREVVFMGDKPAFDAYVFTGCYATLYYPAGNSTWEGLDNTSIGFYVLLPMENVADHELPKEGDPLEGPCGPNATFRLYKGELTIKGTGVVDVCPWSTLAESITKVTISEGITSLASYALANMTNLKHIKLPGSLKTISEYLFENSAITDISIPKGVTRIGSYAFSNCDNLKRIVFPASVNGMGYSVVGQCDNLTGVVFLGKPPAFSFDIFSNWYTFSGYKGYVFTSQWQSWTSADKEKGGSSASWVVGEGGTSGRCGDNATWKVEGGVLTISGIGKMWDFALYRQAPWTHLRDNIKKVVVNDGITTIGNDSFIWMSVIEDIELADSITVIGDDAFRYCYALKTVKLSDSLKTLKEYAFLHCESLEKVVLPDSVEVIEYGAFSDCIKLKEVVISRNIKSIGQQAFEFCASLEQIHFVGNAPEFHRVAFAEVTAIVTYPWLNTTWTNEVLKDYGGKITWQHRACKADHSFWDWERISEPTDATSGLEQRICSNCGFVEEKVIPARPQPPESTGTDTKPQPPTTEPTALGGIVDADMPQKLLSDEAIWMCGCIIVIFVVCSIAIFVSIAVLKHQEKKENEHEK